MRQSEGTQGGLANSLRVVTFANYFKPIFRKAIELFKCNNQLQPSEVLPSNVFETQLFPVLQGCCNEQISALAMTKTETFYGLHIRSYHTKKKLKKKVLQLRW